MKRCSYCGRENDDKATLCQGCGGEVPLREDDSALSDPRSALVTLETFGDLIHATLVKDQLEAAGITACIPEELAANPFGHFVPLAHITVQIAARDFEAAKEILAGLKLPPPSETTSDTARTESGSEPGTDTAAKGTDVS